jgi:integrase/recombinase XerC
MQSPFYPVPAVIPSANGLDPSSPAARLLAAFLSGRKADTIKAYRADLEDFQAFAQAASLSEAAQRLMASCPGDANAQALSYKAHLLERGLSAATVNRRLAALRSLVKLGRTLGLVTWTLEVEGMKSETYRDTKGPGRAGFRDMLDALAKRQDAKGIRDRAILRCLFDLGLRRAEVIRLDMDDFNPEAATVAVLGKGRTEKVSLTLPPETHAAIVAWLAIRGGDPGPLFRSMDPAKKGDGRLSGMGLYLAVRGAGEMVGIKTRPHGLRHAAITEALDVTRGNIRAVQKFSRHRDVRVLERYDDNRLDLAGEVARQVAASVPGEKPAA